MAKVIAPLIIGAAAVGSAVIASSGAKKAAETQAQAQQAQIEVQQQAAEQERQERQAAIVKEEAVRQEAVERKEEAIKNIKYPTYLEGPEALKLKTTLEERLAGRGLAPSLTPLDIDKQTAPFAAQRRAGLAQTSAAIGSAASARGLGRSTIPINEIGKQSQAAERDIEERVANLQIENKKIEESNIERQRKQTDDALARFEALTGRESTSQENKARFERGGEFDIADTITGKAGAISAGEQNLANQFASDQFAIAETIKEKGATEAAGQLLQSQMIASGILNAGLAAQKASGDIIDAIAQEKIVRNQAKVNISGRAERSASLLNPGLGSNLG